MESAQTGGRQPGGDGRDAQHAPAGGPACAAASGGRPSAAGEGGGRAGSGKGPTSEGAAKCGARRVKAGPDPRAPCSLYACKRTSAPTACHCAKHPAKGIRCCPTPLDDDAAL